MMFIEGKPGLVKDPASGAVINTDDEAFRAAKQAKKRVLEARRKEQELEDRLSKLESTLEQLLKERQDGKTN